MGILDRLGGGLVWSDKLPVIRWLLDNADDAVVAVGHIQVILSETDEATERKAIHDLVDVLHPVYWRNPFSGDPDATFSTLAPDAGPEAVAALLPQAPDGSKLKEIIAFLIEHADEAVQIILTLLALFGRKGLR